MATERPKATQSEIDSILNHYNRGKDFLKECWKICAKNNLILPYKLYFDLDDEYYTESDSCKELKKDGVKWKWLPNDILQIIPTMASPYLEHPLDRDIDTPIETEETILTEEDLNADITTEVPNLDVEGQTTESSTENTLDKDEEISEYILKEENYINKIEKHEQLSERELSALTNYSIQAEYGDNERWTRSVNDIIKLEDRYENKYFYSLFWQEGLTEMQENEFFDQPERVYPYEKVTVNKQELFTNDKLIADDFNNNSIDLDFVKGVLENNSISLDLDTGELKTENDVINEEETISNNENEIEESEYDPFEMDF